MKFGVQIRTVTGCKSWLISRLVLVLDFVLRCKPFAVLGKLVLVTVELYSHAVYCVGGGALQGHNSSVEHLHPNGKARARPYLPNLGYELDLRGSRSLAAIVQTYTLLRGRLGCKTWSGL